MENEELAGLPPQVRAQAELVKKYLAETGDTQANDDAGTTDQGTAPTDINQQIEPQTAADTDSTATVQDETQQQADTTPPDVTAQLAAANQRYRVLQGKYDAEVPRLHQQIRELKAELESLHSTRQQAATGNNADTDAFMSISADDLEDQLEDARIEGNMDLVRELRAKIRARDRQEIRQEFEPIRKQAAASADERYISDLNTLASGWDKIRLSPEFIDFLKRPAPFTNTPLSEILNQADAERDAVRVSEIYNAFRPVQESKEPPEQRRTLPANLVTPPRRNAGGPTPQKTVTEAQLTQAAQEVQKGKRSAESYAELENAYFKGLIQ